MPGYPAVAGYVTGVIDRNAFFLRIKQSRMIVFTYDCTTTYELCFGDHKTNSLSLYVVMVKSGWNKATECICVNGLGGGMTNMIHIGMNLLIINMVLVM